MGLKCQNCTNRDDIPDHLNSCPACGTQVEPPNVRAASSEEEVKALSARGNEARTLATADGTIDVLNKFEAKVRSSVAVVACSLAKAKAIVSNNDLYNSFYKQVSSGARIPEDNKFDLHRRAVDERIFPYYVESIVFAALSLRKFGIKAYGGAHLVLKDKAISNRATVFGMNTFTFMDTYSIGTTDPIPPGFRATWEKRSEIAAVQVQPNIAPTTIEDEFPTILLNPDAERDDGHFIEVHIYGEFSRGAIDSAYFMDSQDPADKIIIKSIQLEMDKQNIPNGLE